MRRILSLLVIALPPLLASGAAAQEWTRFRGPNGTGFAESAALPDRWTEADFNWKVQLPGIGHSSPVVWQDRLFLLSADPETATRYVICLATETGQQLWVRQYPSTPHPLHARSSFASSTPAVDQDHVYVMWAAPDELMLVALDHDGREIWQRNLGTWASEHGFGTSPVLYEDLVIFANDQDADEPEPGQKPSQSCVMALDRRTGEERWRTPLRGTKVCYSVPCLYQPDGGDAELIGCNTGDGIYSLDPRTGRRNWSIPVFTMRTVASPVVADGLIFGSTGSGGGGNYVVAVRSGPEPELVYELRQHAAYVPTALAHGELLFLWGDKGIVACIRAADGHVYWSERIGTSHSGSPVRVGNKMYAIDDDGVVVVLAADKTFRELGRNSLGEPSRATPAVSGGRMYFRTLSHVISLGD